MEVVNNPNEHWNKPNNIPEFKVDPVLVLVFSFLTCGLYLIYWNIKVAEVFNAVAEREIISTPLAVFSGCCLPVHVYFYYIVGKDGLPKVYQITGELQKDQSTLLIVLGFFFPLAAAMIVQGDINRLYK
jgi:hypothetical protein